MISDYLFYGFGTLSICAFVYCFLRILNIRLTKRSLREYDACNIDIARIVAMDFYISKGRESRILNNDKTMVLSLQREALSALGAFSENVNDWMAAHRFRRAVRRLRLYVYNNLPVDMLSGLKLENNE